MDDYERDEVPDFRDTDNRNDSTRRGLSTARRGFSATRSASMSIPTNSMDSSEYEHNLGGFTGNFGSQRRTANIQMTGPLYANRNKEFIFQPQVSVRQKTTEPKVEKYPSNDRADSNSWSLEDYVGRNGHLLRSGQLGICHDPYCTSCPIYYTADGHQKPTRTSKILDERIHELFIKFDVPFTIFLVLSLITSQFDSMIYGDAKGWAKRMCSFLLPYIPGVMNPHAKFVLQWNKFFMIACFSAICLDPLFFFLLFVQQEDKCVVQDWPMTAAIVVLRTMADFIYLFHILLQFRVAYVAPESRVAGSGDLVDDPKMIARNYLFGNLLIDFIAILPLPQIVTLAILPGSIGESGSSRAKDLLRAAIIIQLVPRSYRFLPVVAGSSPTGSIFESAWANFVINLLTYVMVSHIIGSWWYLFGLERVNRCFQDACRASNVTRCVEFIDCGHGNAYGRFGTDPTWELWRKNENASACFGKDDTDFGIYQTALNLTTHRSTTRRYVYALFWGFQQISTLAGNQVPSYNMLEVVFTMSIIGSGLLLFALLIGNMQNFLQDLGRRRLEMSLRRRDVDQWMSHRRLPVDLRRQVGDSERFNWAATRGVNEEMLMENLPEDLQREIRRHLFKFMKKVRIFQLLDEPIVDAICERLKTKTYIKGSKILYNGGLVDKMVFIIRGKMVSTGEDGIASPLSEGDVCGEELLTWCLEHSSVNRDGARIRIPGHRLLSNRLVTCLTYVEAFVLRAADLEEVTNLFSRFLRSPRVQGAIRYESPYWRGLAARRIQVAWRYRKKRNYRADSSNALLE